MPTQTTEARMRRRFARRQRARHRKTIEERRVERLLGETYGDGREAGPYNDDHAGRDGRS